MATKYGVNATKRMNSAIPSLEGQGETNSPLKVAFDEYTLTAALSQSDVIKLMTLPPYARVHDVVLQFSASLDASGGTLDCGWEANGVDAVDQDGFMDALDVTTSGGGVFIMTDDKPQRPGIFKQFGNAKTQVYCTATHSGGLDATTGTIRVAVYYAVS